jgi:HEAT repeat protein
MMMSTARIEAGSILRESMSEASQLSPELARGLLQLARALVAAARNWTLYPPEHPTVSASVARLSDAIQRSTLGAIVSIGITPETLLVEGTPADPAQSGVSEAAALLHDRDLLQITFVGEIPDAALHALLRMLALDADERRRRGGPAQMWAVDGHPSVLLEQIDYEKVLAREEGVVPEPAKRDDLWRSIVLSIASMDQTVFDEQSQERLLAIASSVPDIGDLATAVSAPKCTIDGSPMITSQAATVLAAYRYLASIASVKAPERMSEVMNNIAAASSHLDPHLVMQVLQTQDGSDASAQMINGLAGAFDDVKVAQLLATALAIDGKASDRLATIFNTIAPDADRKQRVLTLTRSMLTETDFGKAGQFHTLWSSMEELLVAYNDKPFVSEAYRASLDGVGARAERMSATDFPPELQDWMTSLGQNNVRALSVQMLIDLLTIEIDAKRADEIAEDMEALAEDLLMSGAYEDAGAVIAGLSARGGSPNAIGRDACRHALDRLGESLALRETVSLAEELDDAAWETIRGLVAKIGPSTVGALATVAVAEKETRASQRTAAAIVGFGKAAVSRLSPLVGDERWFAQLTGATLLGAIGTADAVPLLQPLLRKSDPRVARAAVTALGKIDDPSAARAVQTVLRAATGPLRRAVIEALVSERDPRVVPLLSRVIAESKLLGQDHDVVIEMIDALGTVGSEKAMPTLVTTSSVKKLFGGRKLKLLKQHSVDAIVRIGGTSATAALDELARSGDRTLKKVVAQRRQ